MEIKASELRIGNLFIEENSKKTIEVVGLDNNRVVFSGMFLDKWQAKPIPLTEEWLLRFGFEKTNRIDFGELKECFAKFSFALMIRNNKYYVDWIGGNTEIEFVHELQNIYFTLHKTELTTN